RHTRWPRDWSSDVCSSDLHDAHFGLGLAMHKGTPFANDVELREHGVVRIYDVFFDYEVLLSTDAYVRQVSARPEFQRSMSTAERSEERRVGKECRMRGWRC